MAWYGKLIGGLLGFTLGGPLGLIAGIAFGNLFDKADTYDTNNSYTGTKYYEFGQRRMNRVEQRNMLFFVGVFSLLARMSQADSTVSKEERAAVNNFIDNDLNLDMASRDAARRVFEAALVNGGTVEQFARQLYSAFNHDQAILQLTIEALFKVAVADGNISIEEENIIKQVIAIFRFSPSYYAGMKNKYSTESFSDKTAYAVLGLSKDATESEIKKAYRKLSIEYHPDTIASKGLPEEFSKMATQKFREIQTAYEKIKKERNIK
ncbi:MAG: TerB family tellurite resistance protein [Pleomorphochaeta sp.]|jgi:DnaJ like chaperone protein